MNKESKQKTSFFKKLFATKDLFVKDQYRQLKKEKQYKTDKQYKNEIDNLCSQNINDLDSQRSTFLKKLSHFSGLYSKDQYSQLKKSKRYKTDKEFQNELDNIVLDNSYTENAENSRLVDEEFLKKYIGDFEVESERETHRGESQLESYRKTFEMNQDSEISHLDAKYKIQKRFGDELKDVGMMGKISAEWNSVEKIHSDQFYGDYTIFMHQNGNVKLMQKEATFNTESEAVDLLTRIIERNNYDLKRRIQAQFDFNYYEQEFKDQNPRYIVRTWWEFSTNNLGLEMKNRRLQNNDFAHNELIYIAYQMIEALYIGVENQFLHYDVRPEYINTLYADVWFLCHCEYNEFLPYSEMQRRRLNVNNAEVYMSPELFCVIADEKSTIKVSHDTYKSSCWSLGLVLLSAGLLNEDVQKIYNLRLKVIDNILLESLLEKFFNKYVENKPLCEIIEALLSIDVNQRKTPHDLLKILPPYRDVALQMAYEKTIYNPQCDEIDFRESQIIESEYIKTDPLNGDIQNNNQEILFSGKEPNAREEIYVEKYVPNNGNTREEIYVEKYVPNNGNTREEIFVEKYVPNDNNEEILGYGNKHSGRQERINSYSESILQSVTEVDETYSDKKHANVSGTSELLNSIQKHEEDPRSHITKPIAINGKDKEVSLVHKDAKMVQSVIANPGNIVIVKKKIDPNEELNLLGTNNAYPVQEKNSTYSVHDPLNPFHISDFKIVNDMQVSDNKKGSQGQPENSTQKSNIYAEVLNSAQSHVKSNTNTSNNVPVLNPRQSHVKSNTNTSNNVPELNPLHLHGRRTTNIPAGVSVLPSSQTHPRTDTNTLKNTPTLDSRQSDTWRYTINKAPVLNPGQSDVQSDTNTPNNAPALNFRKSYVLSDTNISNNAPILNSRQSHGRSDTNISNNAPILNSRQSHGRSDTNTSNNTPVLDPSQLHGRRTTTIRTGVPENNSAQHHVQRYTNTSNNAATLNSRQSHDQRYTNTSNNAPVLNPNQHHGQRYTNIWVGVPVLPCTQPHVPRYINTESALNSSQPHVRSHTATSNIAPALNSSQPHVRSYTKISNTTLAQKVNDNSTMVRSQTLVDQGNIYNMSK